MRDPRLYEGFHHPSARSDIARHLESLLRARDVHLAAVCNTAFLLQAGEFVDHLHLIHDQPLHRTGPAVASQLACPTSCPFAHAR